MVGLGPYSGSRADDPPDPFDLGSVVRQQLLYHQHTLPVPCWHARGEMLHLATHPSAILVALLHLASALLAGAASLSPPQQPLQPLIRRLNPEHVVLADCRDAKNVVTSQIAYFEDTPGRLPKDVAVVHTSPGEAALWINANTSGLFTDTGVTFTATIGPKVADGKLAGIGYNGYGNFTCWQKYFNNLYQYGGTSCSQVYYCNHEPVPADQAGVLQNLPTATTVASTTATGDATTTASILQPTGLITSTPAKNPQESGLSQAALIGIVVGVVGSVAFVGSMSLLFWSWRRYRRHQHPGTAETSPGCCGLFSRRRSPQQPPQHDPFKASALPLSHKDLKRSRGTYEMDGRHHYFEMGTGQDKYELDGNSPYDDRDKKLVVPEAAEIPLSQTPNRDGYQEIPERSPATSTTAVSEQRVQVRDL